MSVQYQAIGWNRQKKIYDVTLAAAVAAYLILFTGAGALAYPAATAETLLIRGFGTLALLILHVILCIGPLCRLDSRFLPLLYNRRHLGVTMCLAALVHGVFSIVQFHALGDLPPIVSLFVSNTRYRSLANFPFQSLGFVGLLILLLMAVTSHDFWLHNLTAPVWKRIHMLVYAAYGLLVTHVALGALQSDGNVALEIALAIGLVIVSTLHIAAARKEVQTDERDPQVDKDDLIDVCAVDEIAENRARVIAAEGERVAVFRYGGRISAVSNVCRHQGGPLGEGRVVDGCITCPWHGYQYLPESGCAPPPFTEKLATFQTKIVRGRILLDPRPHPPGTLLEPSTIESPRMAEPV